jgi:hypothetical protein
MTTNNKFETRNFLITNPEKNFFEDARKTKQSQIASFSAPPTALCQLYLKKVNT